MNERQVFFHHGVKWDHGGVAGGGQEGAVLVHVAGGVHQVLEVLGGEERERF